MQIDKSMLMIIGVILLWIGIAILGRIIPHPANATPLAALAILSGYAFYKNWAVLMTLISLCVSDILLGLLQNQPISGDWSLFTYSGYMLLAFWAPQRSLTKKKMVIWEYVLVSTLIYWIWTNFGTWLTSGMYLHDGYGFFECYLAGVPFLRNALLGTVIYTAIFLPGVNKLLSISSGFSLSRFAQRAE